MTRGYYVNGFTGGVAFRNFNNSIASIADGNEDFQWTCNGIALAPNEYK